MFLPSIETLDLQSAAGCGTLLSPNTVRLELALLSHMFTVTIQSAAYRR